MKKLKDFFNSLFPAFLRKNKQADLKKAGEKWDSIVQELSKRK